MPAPHQYRARLTWSGSAAGPASDYRTYSRAFRCDIAGKEPLIGSADPAFLGDPARHNPEDHLLVALASCHMLSWLSLCVRKGIHVQDYVDEPQATMSWVGDTYAFTDLLLRPRATIAAGDAQVAQALHADAHRLCFIARSVNFPVRHEATVAFPG
jgi:organic hydroperoxide reductase OsmC/OhrA